MNEIKKKFEVVKNAFVKGDTCNDVIDMLNDNFLFYI